jgi:hypothetical protein
MLRTTHTYVTLAVSESTYNEIAEKFKAAGYDHVFHRDGRNRVVIDMQGIALEKEKSIVKEVRNSVNRIPQD